MVQGGVGVAMGAPGFDDAPVETMLKASLPKPLTVVYPYYENPEFLARQMEAWKVLPVYLIDYVCFVIVDDGSPTHPAVDVVRKHKGALPLRLFRIEVDVRWNWLAARNIGMHHAEEGWCVMTDMDHVLTERVLDHLIYRAYDASTIYRFSRVEHTGETIHPHPNSMLMTRSMFWKVGGYDETLSGCYGTDGDWRRRCAATAPVRTLKDALVRYEYVGDSSTTHYLRKQPEDARKKKLLAARRPGWRPKVLSFPYSEVTL